MEQRRQGKDRNRGNRGRSGEIRVGVRVWWRNEREDKKGEAVRAIHITGQRRDKEDLANSRSNCRGCPRKAKVGEIFMEDIIKVSKQNKTKNKNLLKI